MFLDLFMPIVSSLFLSILSMLNFFSVFAFFAYSGLSNWHHYPDFEILRTICLFSEFLQQGDLSQISSYSQVRPNFKIFLAYAQPLPILATRKNSVAPEFKVRGHFYTFRMRKWIWFSYNQWQNWDDTIITKFLCIL